VVARLYATSPHLKPPFDNNTKFPLKEAYYSRPTDTAAPYIIKAATLTAIKSSPIDNMSSRILYSDGSLLHSGTEDVAMGFSVVDPQQDIHLPIKGRTDGHASSTKAELMGLIAAVVAAPDEQDIVVRLDNQSVVDQFQHMVQDRENTLPRKWF
ncbi:hypothetical protein BGZ97_008548, partial [Linnemannia gamsii]